MDGYPSGHGKELKDFLTSIKMVNGLSFNQTNVANGMECLAAQLIAELKTEAGSIYLYNPNKDMSHYSYKYVVYPSDYSDNPEICIKCLNSSDEVIFNGLVSEFDTEE